MDIKIWPANAAQPLTNIDYLLMTLHVSATPSIVSDQRNRTRNEGLGISKRCTHRIFVNQFDILLLFWIYFIINLHSILWATREECSASTAEARAQRSSGSNRVCKYAT